MCMLVMQVFVYAGTVSGFCAMCELQSHIGKVFGGSGVAVRPVQIVQNLKSEPSHNQLAQWLQADSRSCVSV